MDALEVFSLGGFLYVIIFPHIDIMRQSIPPSVLLDW